MKAILTSFLILVINLSFAQTAPVSYIYLDAKANKFELVSGALTYTPSGTIGIYTGTTTKTVTLSKVEEADLQNLFKAAIDATTDQVATNETGSGAIKYKKFTKLVTIHLKSGAGTKTKLENSIAALIAK